MGAHGTAGKPFVFHSDPSHGWLRVSIREYYAVGLTLEDISSCSYIDSRSLFLEEDGDAGVFLNAWRKANGGADPAYVERDSDSRSYIRWKPSVVRLGDFPISELGLLAVLRTIQSRAVTRLSESKRSDVVIRLNRIRAGLQEWKGRNALTFGRLETGHAVARVIADDFGLL